MTESHSPNEPAAPGGRRIRRSVTLLFAVLALTVAACAGTPAATPVPAATPAPASPSVAAGACPESQPEPLAAGESRTVTIATRLGEIVIQVEADWSPIAAGNFVALAGCGYYDGVVFHRTASLQDGTPFVIQGGDPTGSGSGGPGYTIADEPVTETYRRGTVAMARSSAPNSQGSQFFIVLDDAVEPILSSYNTYAIFGVVTSGIEVADAILADADGELPTNPVAMDRVTVSTP